LLSAVCHPFSISLRTNSGRSCGIGARSPFDSFGRIAR
jgi:hypothetical protein